MIKTVFIRVLFLTLLTAFFADATSWAGDVVAEVGKVPITRFELQREADKLIPLNASYHSGLSREKALKIKKEAMDALVVQAYKFLYALENEIALDNGEFQKAFDRIRSDYASEKDFKAALGKETASDMRASLYRKLLADKAEKIAVDDKVQVSEEEIRSYYEGNKASYFRPKQYRASHIMVKVDPSSNATEIEEYRKRAEALLARAKAGEDFYNLAYYNSDDPSKFVGGDIGYFHEGRAAKEFESAVLKMKPGEISDLVRSRFGFHIIKLTEVNESRQLTFEEMKNKIRENLEAKERTALYETWMNNLKGRYEVRILAGENTKSAK